jgi:uncharacterized protein YrrD
VDIQALKGQAVVAVQDGQRLGEVSDVLLSPVERRVVRLQVRSGGLFGRRVMQVEMEAITSIGPDAVMVPSRDSVRVESEPASGELLRLRELTRLRVVSDQGRLLGTVSGATLETPSGRLQSVEVVPAGLSGILGRRRSIPIDRVVSIGRDVVVVPEIPTEEDASGAPEHGPPSP